MPLEKLGSWGSEEALRSRTREIRCVAAAILASLTSPDSTRLKVKRVMRSVGMGSVAKIVNPWV